MIIKYKKIKSILFGISLYHDIIYSCNCCPEKNNNTQQEQNKDKDKKKPKQKKREEASLNLPKINNTTESNINVNNTIKVKTERKKKEEDIYQYNKRVFEDTLSICNNTPFIKTLIDKSISKQMFIEENSMYNKPEIKGKKGDIILENMRTIQSAVYHLNLDKGKKIAILNFANWNNPGGGVKNGCLAQEESLCRCTSLYINLTNNNVADFYKKHDHKNYEKANDDIIYSPDVYILKNDDDTNNIKTLDFDEKRVVDVITCAAPCNNDNFSDDDIYNIHKKRINRILEIATLYNVDIIILGAHGCGAFNNNPASVAKAYKEIFKQYKNKFDKIILAIPKNCGYGKDNFTVFQSILNINITI